MKISELQVNQRGISIEGIVKEITPIKEFSKFGRPGRVCSAIVEDESGKIALNLWNEQIDLVKKGDKVRVTGAYVKEWQSQLQINVGKIGKIEVL